MRRVSPQNRRASLGRDYAIPRIFHHQKPIADADPIAAAQTVEEAIEKQLDELVRIPLDELVEQRFQKYRNMGNAEEET